jgi:pimeloyl-ACP methyl ester carboxylesterase
MTLEAVLAKAEADGMKTLILPDGRLIEYHVAGPADGVPCLNMHGGALTARIYGCEPLQPLYQKHKLRMISPTRANCGLSDRSRPNATIRDYVDDALAVLNHETGSSTGSFFLTGYSLGGVVMMELLATCPERVLAGLLQSSQMPPTTPGISPGAKTFFQLKGAWFGDLLYEFMIRDVHNLLDACKIYPPSWKVACVKLQQEHPSLYAQMNDEWMYRAKARNKAFRGLFAMFNRMQIVGPGGLEEKLKRVHATLIIAVDPDEMEGMEGLVQWLRATLPNTSVFEFEGGKPSGFSHMHAIIPEIVDRQYAAMLGAARPS